MPFSLVTISIQRLPPSSKISTFLLIKPCLAPATATTTGDKIAFLASAHTSGTGASGQKVITVADATNISEGDLVYGRNIASGAYVTAVSGTSVTIT